MQFKLESYLYFEFIRSVLIRNPVIERVFLSAGPFKHLLEVNWSFRKDSTSRYLCVP